MSQGTQVTSEVKPTANPAHDLLKNQGLGALQEAVKNGTIRSLTNEARKSRFEMARREELASCSEHEAVVITVPKKEKGKFVLDEDGYQVLTEKKVRKHDLINRKWDAKIAAMSIPV